MNLGPVLLSILAGLSVLLALVTLTTLLVDGLQVRVQGDLLVYRAGSRAWLDGATVYTSRLDLELGAGSMYFTYAPIALLLFVPLAVLPLSASEILLGVVTITCLLLAVGLWIRRYWPTRHPWLVVLLLSFPVSVLTPVREHLQIGQVNAVLLLLVTADLCLRKTPWPRGAALGLAMAVKLTPAAILLFPLLYRRYRLLAVALVTAIVATLASWLIVPKEASHYWLVLARDPGRVGNLRNPSNQSLRGVIERFIDGPGGGLLWLVGCVVIVGVVSWLVIRRFRPDGDEEGATATVFLLPLLLSPVAWTHHWVWSIPMLLWLSRPRVVVRRLAAALGLTLFILFPLRTLAAGSLVPGSATYSPWAAAFAGPYVYWALGVLVALAWSTARRPSRRAPR